MIFIFEFDFFWVYFCFLFLGSIWEENIIGFDFGIYDVVRYGLFFYSVE